ncbi:2-hydroxyacyl-CoA lyase 2-like [Apostichopus japonicus]|uniref:2-hydroxyacyl-CoA lyase 2-like n=1 Tax=Stichopus japonicus TaxID=307972 RepID=UPI003AB3AAED
MAIVEVLLYTIGTVVLLLLAAIAFAAHKYSIIYQFFHPPAVNSKSNGGDIVAEVLKAHGVKFLFTLCGGHISPINVAAEREGIRVIDTRHEVTAVFAADAVARMTGAIGAAVVTAGPGLTNTITAVKNAQMAETPVLLMGGAAVTLLKGRGALQDIDQMSLFKPLCKFCAAVQTVRDIAPVLREAIRVAQSDTPGPVFVEFPIDVLYDYQNVLMGVGLNSPKGDLMSKIVNMYTMSHIGNIFAGGFELREYGPLPVDRPIASSGQVQQAVELVSRAKKPLIILGSQATLPPTPVDELRKALEAMGIPCFLGGMTRGMLGRNSPLHIRQRRRDALKEADVVILAGAVPDFRLNYGRVLSKRSKIIAVNRNKSQLLLNAGVMWRPALAVQADVGSFLLEVSKGLTGFNCSSEWIQSLKVRDEEKETSNLKKAEDKVNHFLNPLKVLYQVEEAMDEESIIVADGGDFVGSAAYILRPRGPLKWLDPGAFGTLGVGGGFALGAKLCRPDCEVWIIYGDGTLGYSVAEFDTFNRHKIPVIAVVGNDACWTQIVRDQEKMFSTRVACDLTFCDYDKVAIGYGGTGYRLSEENAEGIKEILMKAKEDSKNNKPALVNCLIGKTDFREGSLSV